MCVRPGLTFIHNAIDEVPDRPLLGHFVDVQYLACDVGFSSRI